METLKEASWCRSKETGDGEDDDEREEPRWTEDVGNFERFRGGVGTTLHGHQPCNSFPYFFCNG